MSNYKHSSYDLYTSGFILNRDLPQFGHKSWQTQFGKTFDIYAKVIKKTFDSFNSIIYIQ